MIELGMSIVAACLPTLRTLFGDVLASRLYESIRNLLTFKFLSTSRLGGNVSTEELNGSVNMQPSAGYRQMLDGASDTSTYAAEAYHLKQMNTSRSAET